MKINVSHPYENQIIEYLHSKLTILITTYKQVRLGSLTPTLKFIIVYRSIELHCNTIDKKYINA